MSKYFTGNEKPQNAALSLLFEDSALKISSFPLHSQAEGLECN